MPFLLEKTCSNNSLEQIHIIKEIAHIYVPFSLKENVNEETNVPIGVLLLHIILLIRCNK